MPLHLSKQVYKPRRNRTNFFLVFLVSPSEKAFPAIGDNINASLLCCLVIKVHLVSRNVEILERPKQNVPRIRRFQRNMSLVRSLQHLVSEAFYEYFLSQSRRHQSQCQNKHFTSAKFYFHLRNIVR